MKPEAAPLSRSVEDYLKAIHALAEQGETASTSRIASALDVQPASVSGMMKRLAESGYVDHLPYRGVTLTESGIREALRVVRRHRILETYLTRRLGYGWDDVHSEAERLEHAVSDRLIERMAHALGHPSHDPHGAPIPTACGAVEPPHVETLASATPGDEVRIRAVGDKDPERLRYLEARGLLPGVILSVESRSSVSGPMTVRVGGREGSPQTIGAQLASRIRISNLRDEA
jgi:DtxR family Mn-dependent transcriptional regulator